ncbi:hypothetical protein [Kocuria turfanensis]|uniref:Uncharacterized protein n=1 Tax=Kocuria turfanensis TaxID=388357 RepID=A0A512IHM1_9MICC|nr:hypothetical protein [Kocuria turfanensis]GEO97209.1 hypothetical protein KTU01_33320 [Kocuria turfanensis]
MGLNELLARFAVRAAQVLVVEVPGHWDARMELEQQLLRRGWRPASTPADADVLAVCGVPGPELSELVDRLWEQMPGPRVRADITSPGGVGPALDDAAALLLDTPHHRTDARERPQEPEIPEDVDHGGHGGMDHGEMDHGEMDHGEMDHGEMDHGGHGGHGGMDHSGHGGMDMAPGGIALAGGGEDRDGLEMDVLHLPLGPVLPFWPAGLVLHCSLQGDVVVDAEASVVDGAGAGGPGPGPAPAAVVVWCDQVVALLALAGAEDAASGARRARDALLHGDRGAARAAAERLHRTIRRSRLLRWSLRGVLPLDPSALEHHGLPRHCLGDAHDRLLSRVERIRAEAGGAVPVPVEDGAVPWAVLPELVTGLELASVRLAVASLGLDPHPAVQEVGHG